MLDASQLIREELIFPNLEAQDNLDAVGQLADQLKARGFVRDTFKAAVLKREQIYPSGLPMPGHKIAIPHTDAEHVIAPTIAFARLTRPVPWHVMGDPSESMDVQLVSMFALNDPKEVSTFLVQLITVYQDSEILGKLLKASSTREIMDTLKAAMAAQQN